MDFPDIDPGQHWRARDAASRDEMRGWLFDSYGISLETFLSREPREVDKILVAWGQEKYERGDAAGTFTNTILACCDEAPELRRSTPRAWELLDHWLTLMPFTNHVPCPPALLLAMMSLAILWGWVDMAVFLALSWTGLLRPVEALRLCRADVLLPSELLSAERAVFLRIRSPKMRRLRARREHVKITDLVVVGLLEVVLVGIAPERELFPFRPSQLRRWHDALVSFFKVSTSDGVGVTPASHRGGGATALFNQTDCLDLTRWRGRWSTSSRTMEIYIQEVGAAAVLPSLSAKDRDRVRRFASMARSLVLAVGKP